ncbi:hypothetical protein MtrunA17_Chr4g0041961 [Medicago truncatula]|uniref:Uncharacterized protein n=1 Tax=Medicago truncatula TaxID=3880 RepID=A0A396I8J6_MEDTR|nr:hypothetical protein MtrunA17_Chr4g0041961 [Medicago truncatula]
MTITIISLALYVVQYFLWHLIIRRDTCHWNLLKSMARGIALPVFQ